jgi:anaerobic selenocysteine-containing dehydrogenase
MWLLPCLGRIEIDRQKGVAQNYTTEDSTGCIHGWHGSAEPVGPHVRAEASIVAGLAMAALAPGNRIDWQAWCDDYSTVRTAIGTIYPQIFHDMETRMAEPGGFHRPIAAAQREWLTPTGKAQFVTPVTLAEDDDVNLAEPARDVLQLMTLRSNDQFNTTIYGYDDRFRGVSGTREVIFMHCNDIARLGFKVGQQVLLTTAIEPEVKRQVGPFEIIAYDIPEGCAAAYYPECNPLVPLWHHAERSKVPAAKSVPMRLSSAGG